MATDLPFHNSSRSETTFYGGARLGRKKRYIVFGLIAAVFFVLWFSADMSSNSVQQHSSSNEMAQDNAKDNTVLQDEVNQAKEEEDEVQDDAVIVESTTTTTKAKTAKAKAKSTTTTTTTTTAAAKTTTSSIELAKELPLIVETNHLKYFVVIASEANSFERRKLIRSSYFGMDNNVEPCMGSEKKGISYAFWLYGDAPQSKTPERRVYEAEKMEWFDLHQTTDAEFDQVKAMKWAKQHLVENDLTFDYLIIQDGNSFMHLPWIQQQILAEEGKFEDGKKPGELIWTKFTGDKNVLVVGSAALDVLEARDQFISDEPIADFYEYYRTIHIQRKATKDKKEIARLQAILDQLPRVLDDKNERFLEWQNNVEVIPDMAVAVSNVFQNDDFTTLSKALRLSAVSVCKSRNLPLTAVVTSSFIYKDGCMEPSAYLAAVNKRDYALRHNYAFVARSLEFAQQELRPVKRRTVWGKVDVLEKVLPKYDWVFWMDMDAVIMNMDQSVHSILDGLRKKYPKGAAAFESTVDLVVVKPGRDKMLNAGVLLLRNSEWSRQFIRQVQNTESWYNKSPSYEQGAMWEVMSNPIHQEHIIVLEDNHVFNTFPQFYQPGDFVVHFAPDKCPSPAVLKGLKAAERIESGQVITSLDES